MIPNALNLEVLPWLWGIIWHSMKNIEWRWSQASIHRPEIKLRARNFKRRKSSKFSILDDLLVFIHNISENLRNLFTNLLIAWQHILAFIEVNRFSSGERFYLNFEFFSFSFEHFAISENSMYDTRFRVSDIRLWLISKH